MNPIAVTYDNAITRCLGGCAIVLLACLGFECATANVPRIDVDRVIANHHAQAMIYLRAHDDSRAAQEYRLLVDEISDYADPARTAVRRTIYSFLLKRSHHRLEAKAATLH